MSSTLERVPEGGRVAVIRLRSMGDCVLTTPAISILKSARPDLWIGVVVEERFRAIFEGNPDVGEILPPRWTALRGARPDLCLNLHGGAASARLTALSGAKFRAGFAHFRYSPVYNEKIPRAQQILRVERKVHTAEHLASAMFYLGAPKVEIPRAKLFIEPAGRESRESAPYAVLHPEASSTSKTWPAERFLEIASHLENALDLEPVFIGAGEGLAAFRKWRTYSGAPLHEIKSLIAGAAMFIGNDSGPAHVAAAFGIPAVVIFGASDPVIWGPWRTPSEVLAATDGIAAISFRQVVEALERLGVRA